MAATKGLKSTTNSLGLFVNTNLVLLPCCQAPHRAGQPLHEKRRADAAASTKHGSRWLTAQHGHDSSKTKHGSPQQMVQSMHGDGVHMRTSKLRRSPMTAAVLPPSLLQNLAKSSRYALYRVLRMISMFISSRSSATGQAFSESDAARPECRAVC